MQFYAIKNIDSGKMVFPGKGISVAYPIPNHHPWKHMYKEHHTD